MAGTVKIPGIGEVKTSYVMIGGAVVVGIVGFAYYQHSKNSALAAATQASSATGAATTASIDPQTGYPYGSAQDQAALEAMNGATGVNGIYSGYGSYGPYYMAEGPYGPTYGGYAWDAADGQYDIPINTATGTGTTTTTTTAPTTNSQWYQEASADPAGTGDANLDNALTLYLAAQAQASQTDYQAVANTVNWLGVPPQAGYKLLPPAGTSTTPPPPAGTVPGATSGLSVIKTSNTGITATWHPAAGATSYSFQITPKDSAAHNIGARTSYNVGGLRTNTAYTVHVAGVNATGTGSYETASFTTG